MRATAVSTFKGKLFSFYYRAFQHFVQARIKANNLVVRSPLQSHKNDKKKKNLV